MSKEMEREELKLQGEVKKESKALAWFSHSHTFKILLSFAIFVALISGILILSNNSSKIYIEDSEISAPVISLGPSSQGILDKVFVNEGDSVYENMIVAQVNGNSIKAGTDGLVIFVQNTPGQIVNAQTPVVKMIDPQELRAVGHIQEDKGLSDIKVGQSATFTVDAFGSKEYTGVVDSIAPSSTSQDIVFSISNKRQEKEFDVKVKFDVSAYPELKNGMSAKMWVHK